MSAHAWTTEQDSGGWEEHTRARTKEFLTQGVPLVGTLVFGAVVGQATTLLVSRLGTDAVAATTGRVLGVRPRQSVRQVRVSPFHSLESGGFTFHVSSFLFVRPTSKRGARVD